MSDKGLGSSCTTRNYFPRQELRQKVRMGQATDPALELPWFWNLAYEQPLPGRVFLAKGSETPQIVGADTIRRLEFNGKLHLTHDEIHFVIGRCAPVGQLQVRVCVRQIRPNLVEEEGFEKISKLSCLRGNMGQPL